MKSFFFTNIFRRYATMTGSEISFDDDVTYGYVSDDKVAQFTYQVPPSELDILRNDKEVRPGELVGHPSNTQIVKMRLQMGLKKNTHLLRMKGSVSLPICLFCVEIWLKIITMIFLYQLGVSDGTIASSSG